MSDSIFYMNYDCNIKDVSHILFLNVTKTKTILFPYFKNVFFSRKKYGNNYLLENFI